MRKFTDNLASTYFLLEEGKINPLPARVKTLHHLATYLLRDFIEANDFKYSMKGKVEILEWLVNKQTPGAYTRYSAIPNVARLIGSCYEVHKKDGTYPINKREREQIEFMFKKDFETALLREDANKEFNQKLK